MSLHVLKNRGYKRHGFRISVYLASVFFPVPERHLIGIITAKVGAGCGELVADALYGVLVGHNGCYLAVGVEPIFDVMLVSSLVMEPGVAHTCLASAYADWGPFAVKVFHRLKKLGRRKLREVVYQSAKGDTAPYAVYKNPVLVLYDYAEMTEKAFYFHLEKTPLKDFYFH